MTITVSVPHDRTKLGKLSLDDFECACYCKADNAAAVDAGNPSRDPLLEDGDTPTGRYLAVVDGVRFPEHSYGPHPVIVLTAVSGDALDSKRTGLLVHSGPLNAVGALRPTHGCIRDADDDQAELVRRMQLQGGRGVLEVVEITE
jgi:hypothetical protein